MDRTHRDGKWGYSTQIGFVDTVVSPFFLSFLILPKSFYLHTYCLRTIEVLKDPLACQCAKEIGICFSLRPQ